MSACVFVLRHGAAAYSNNDGMSKLANGQKISTVGGCSPALDPPPKNTGETLALLRRFVKLKVAPLAAGSVVTDVGSTLQNSATTYFTNGDDGTQASANDTTVAITAIESGLTATKAITNVTGGKQPTDPIALGDIAQYVLTIPNLGNATAHDVNIIDTLPPELSFFAGYTPMAQINGLGVAGFVPTPIGTQLNRIST